MLKYFLDFAKLCVNKNIKEKECKLENLENKNITNQNEYCSKNSDIVISLSEESNHNLIKKKSLIDMDQSNTNCNKTTKSISNTEHNDVNKISSKSKNFHNLICHNSKEEKVDSIRIKEKINDFQGSRLSRLFTLSPNMEETSEKVFCMNNIIILDNEINQAKKLTVEDEIGSLLFKKILVIDASGLVNSIRNIRDGHVFFGPVSEYKNCIINDFIINFSKELCKTRLFVIFYERTAQKYFIRNINDTISNRLLYIKIIKPYQIKQKQFFILHNIVMSIDPNYDSSMKQAKDSLKITIFKNIDHSHVISKESTNSLESTKSVNSKISLDKEISNQSTTYYYDSSQSPIEIGRSKCTLQIKNLSLSKKHCCILYNRETNLWEINDGSDGKSSLNGTWLIVNTKYEISEKTYVKVDSNVIKINIH